MIRINRFLKVLLLAGFIVLGIALMPGGRYCPLRFSRPASLFPPPPFAATWGKAQALPMFGRKYDMSCSVCHAQGVFPRLNDVGFKFRRAGFRLPEEIGMSQKEKFEIGHYFSAAGRDTFHVVMERDTTTGETDHRAAFEPGEFTLYPLTGSLGKYWATQGELAINTEGNVELENSNVRFVYGKEKSFVALKGGVFHALEGYGGSDRPIGLNFPLFMEASTGRDLETLFTMVEPSLLGIEAGYTYKNANLSVALSNSVRPKVEGDEVEPTHFFSQGNSPKDVQVVFNQLLGTKGSGITLYYYTGGARLPQDPDGFVDGTNTALYPNRFHRGAFFATYYPVERLALLGGASLGRDKFFDTTAGAVSGSFTSWGAFGELNFFPRTGLGLGARYDFFEPGMQARNTEQAGSFFVNFTPVDFVQLIFDYQYLRNLLDPAGLHDTHTVATRVMFLY